MWTTVGWYTYVCQVAAEINDKAIENDSFAGFIKN